MPATFGTVVIILMHTPLWVWPLYVLLLFLGFQRTRDGTVRLWRMLILPVVVTLLAILGLIGAGPSALSAALLGGVIGGVAGWRLEPKAGVRRLPDGRIWLRGEWWTLSQIALVLVFRYAVNVAPVINPALHTDLVWSLSTVLISTTLSALFLGRVAARLRVYFAVVPAAA